MSAEIILLLTVRSESWIIWEKCVDVGMAISADLAGESCVRNDAGATVFFCACTHTLRYENYA